MQEENDENHDNQDNLEKRKKSTSKGRKGKELHHQVGYKISRQSSRVEEASDESASLVAKPPVDFSESFMAKLRVAFIEQQWRIQREKNSVTINSLTLSPAKQILIKNTDDGMVFSGSANSEKEIVLAANAYQEACREEGEKIVFEVDAKSEDAAIAFMSKLKKEGFDITKISAINCKGMDLAGKSMKEYTKEMMAKIENVQPKTTMTPKPKLPGSV